jgi:hypothetical protein
MMSSPKVIFELRRLLELVGLPFVSPITKPIDPNEFMVLLLLFRKP